MCVQLFVSLICKLWSYCLLDNRMYGIWLGIGTGANIIISKLVI